MKDTVSINAVEANPSGPAVPCLAYLQTANCGSKGSCSCPILQRSLLAPHRWLQLLRAPMLT